MLEGVVDNRGLFMWSRNDEMHSMEPLKPLRIGLFLFTLCLEALCASTFIIPAIPTQSI